jgi:hypothetical protein
MKISAAVVLSLLTVSAFAQSDGTVLEIVNQSSLTVSGVSGFPLDAAGNFIEDNLGGLLDELPPGTTGLARFSGDCGPMLAVVMLENGTDLRTNLDTCKDTAIVVSDPASPGN